MKPILPLTMALSMVASTLSLHCSLFDTREPQPPSQTSFHFDPPVRPEIAISNLKYAVQEKNVANYISCFVDPLTSSLHYSFIPSSDGAGLTSWTLNDERSYFENLRTSTGETGFSLLTLTPRNNPIPSDTVRYEFGYTLTFMHTKPGVPTTVGGHMELSLAVGTNGWWAIYAWTDYRDSTDTWSRLKVEFQ